MQKTSWVAAFALFATFSVGVWLVEIRSERLREEADVARSAASTTRQLEEHAARALEAGDLILMLMVDMARDGDLAPPDQAATMARLKAVVDRSPQVGAGWFLDRDGGMIFDSWSYPPKPGNYAYREYFQAHQGDHAGLFIGPMETGTTRGRPRFTLSRPIRENGEFAGVAVASVQAEYFADFYRDAALGEGAAIHLLTLDGRVLSSWSAGPAPPHDLLEQIRMAGPQASDAFLRVGAGRDLTLVSVRRLEDYPVMVVAARSLHPALAPWRERTLRSGLAVGAALLGFALLMVMGLNSARRERRAVAGLEQARADLEREVAVRSAEAERRKRDLRLIADALPALIAFVDKDGRYRFVNRAYQTWFSREPEDIIGLTPADLVGTDVTAAARSRHEAAMAGQWVVYDTVLPMPDGSRREVEIQYIPHTGPEGEEGGFYAFAIDVTARRAAERALRDSEQRYRSLFEAMDQGFAIHELADEGTDHRYLQVNPAFERLTGLVAEEVIGRTMREVLPDVDDGLIERYTAVVRTGQSDRFEEFVAPLGRWYEIYAFPVGPARFAILFNDITERKQAEERQALLMAELDHRVRNILASVQSMVLLTAHSATTKEQYAEILRGRVAAMARAHGLLTQCGWRGARLDQIVRDELAPYAGHAGGIAIEGPGNCVLKPKDALNFALVLHELATNAAKYGALSDPGGHVAVRWETAGDGPLRLTWEESGGPPVIPPSRRGFGSVLIESALGGDGATAVELSFPPEGARCVITLPRQRLVDRAAGPEVLPPPAVRVTAAAPPAAPPAATGAPAAPPAMTAPRVLVVEDELLVAMEIANALKLAGFTVVGPATTLGAGLTMAAHEAVDVAVLDVNLNGRLSVPIADVLIERAIPFLVASGYDIAGILPEHLRDVPALQKPVDSAVLVTRLRRMLAAAPAHTPARTPAHTPALTERPAAPQS